MHLLGIHGVFTEPCCHLWHFCSRQCTFCLFYSFSLKNPVNSLISFKNVRMIHNRLRSWMLFIKLIKRTYAFLFSPILFRVRFCSVPYKLPFLTLSCLRTSAARPHVPSDLPVRGGHVSGGGRPAGAARVTPDVAQPAAAQRPGGPHHFRPHGPGARAQLRGHRQELRLPWDQGAHPQTDPGEPSPPAATN